MPMITNADIDRMSGLVAQYVTKWVTDHRRWCDAPNCQELPHRSDGEIVAVMREQRGAMLLRDETR